MPELPDVAAFESYFASSALHQHISKTSVLDKRILKDTTPGALGRSVKGGAFEETRRHGKYLFARVDGRGWLVLHFGMTGGLEYFKRNGDVPRYGRVVFDFSSGYSLAVISQRLFGRVGFADDLDEFVHRQDLGPDALGPGFTAKYLADYAAEHAVQVKSLLMDQSAVAGLGNIYADETLFQARIHPKTRTGELSKKDIARLHRVIQRVLKTALRHDANTKQLPKTYLVRHRKKGEKCPACGGKIETATVAGRTSYFCPKCQKAPSKEAVEYPCRLNIKCSIVMGWQLQHCR